MMNPKGTIAAPAVVAPTAAPAPTGSTYYLITQNPTVKDAVTSLYCITQNRISIRLRCADDRWQGLEPGYVFSENNPLKTSMIIGELGEEVTGEYNIDPYIQGKAEQLGLSKIHVPVLFWGVLQQPGFVVLKDGREHNVSAATPDEVIIGGNPREDYAQKEYARHPESHQGNPIVRVLHGLNPEVAPQEWISDDGIPWKEAASKVLQKERELQGVYDLKGVHCELLIDTMKEHEARWCSLGDVNTFYRFIAEKEQPEAYKQLKKILDSAKYHSASIVGYGIGKGWPGDEVIEQRMMQQESNQPPPGSGSGGGFSPST